MLRNYEKRSSTSIKTSLQRRGSNREPKLGSYNDCVKLSSSVIILKNAFIAMVFEELLFKKAEKGTFFYEDCHIVMPLMH